MFLFCKWFPHIKSKFQNKKKHDCDTNCIIEEILNQSGED